MGRPAFCGGHRGLIPRLVPVRAPAVAPLANLRDPGLARLALRRDALVSTRRALPLHAPTGDHRPAPPHGKRTLPG
jgi:hypothetical protein